MGVTLLMHWQPSPGAHITGQHYSDVLQLVDQLLVDKIGEWQATCTLQKPVIRDGQHPPEGLREMFSMTFSEDKNHQYYVLRHLYNVLEADNNIEAIMEKLQIYRPRMSMIFEGNLYRTGDFHVKVGKAVPSFQEQIRGIIFEVEYVPSSSLEDSRENVKEFFATWQSSFAREGMNGRFIVLDPPFSSQDVVTCKEWSVSSAYNNGSVVFFFSDGWMRSF